MPKITIEISDKKLKALKAKAKKEGIRVYLDKKKRKPKFEDYF